MRLNHRAQDSLRVLILDGTCDLDAFFKAEPGPASKYDLVICQFWASAQTLNRLTEYTGGTCFSLRDVVEDYGKWEREAFELVEAVCSSGPLHNGLRWRSYLREALNSEFLVLVAARYSTKLVEQSCRDCGAERAICDVILSSRNRKAFELCAGQSEVMITFKQAETAGHASHSQSDAGRARRIARRCGEVLLTGEWRTQFWHLLAELDHRYQRRAAISKAFRRPRVSKGGTALLSSYINNSRTIRAFEKLLPGPVTWVVTNYSARAGTEGTTNPAHWIWRFASEGARPALTDDLSFDYQGSSLAWVALSEWLTGSPAWNGWKKIHLAALANLTSCWEAYLDHAQPDLIVTASQWGLEGWLTRIARKRGIAVLQIAHGVLGGYFYTGTPIASDALVVSGDFWRQLWPIDQQPNIFTYSPVGHVPRIERSESSGRPRLTFFSWPLQLLPHYCASDYTDQVIQLLHRLISGGECDVTVRAHPAENPHVFVQRWNHFYGKEACLPRISKQEPLSDVLEQTDLALMLRSTVLLNCLANGIPVVMPGWVPTGWGDAVDALRGESQIYPAQDFSDMEMTVRQWLTSPPVAQESSPLLRPEGEGIDEFKSIVARLTTPRSLHSTETAPSVRIDTPAGFPDQIRAQL
ncbi:MAG TPA: hypothetical protein VI756_04305 [Blastocatellia bacterium]